MIEVDRAGALETLTGWGALERWRSGIAQHAVEPVEWPVHLDVYPVRRRMDVFTIAHYSREDILVHQLRFLLQNNAISVQIFQYFLYNLFNFSKWSLIFGISKKKYKSLLIHIKIFEIWGLQSILFLVRGIYQLRMYYMFNKLVLNTCNGIKVCFLVIIFTRLPLIESLFKLLSEKVSSSTCTHKS